MSQTIPKEISTAAARMLEPYAPGLTAEALAERITYQPEAESEHYLTRLEAARRTRLSVVSIDRCLREGLLPKRKVRGKVLIPASAVEDLLNGKAGA